jgi:cytochrome c peroxidase
MSGLERSKRLHTAAAAAAIAAFAVLSGAAQAQLPPPPQPPGNPLTAAKANLGKVLFWDEQISSTRTVACGTCHIPVAGGSDPRSGVDPLAAHPGPDGLFGGPDDILGSPGVPVNQADGLYGWSTHFGLLPQVTGRRTPSSINAGYAPELFWDGRALDEFVDPVTAQVVLATGGALESQSVGPPLSDVEMADAGRIWTDVLARIAAIEPLALTPNQPHALRAWIADRGYAELFEEAFGTPAITAARVAMAIASYERTQFTNQTPFDQFLANGTGLTPQEEAGRAVFVGVGRCDDCHQLAIMTDHAFKYIGVRPLGDDPGRMAVTGQKADEGRMRTPSLRNVELRPPFMHNGRFATLEEVVEFYDRDGDFFPNELEAISLTAEQKVELLAFLKRPLTDPRLEAGLPPFDRPMLYTESSRVPRIVGAGLPGTGDLVPAAVALEPPLIGNPSFTVGVWNGFGGAAALLVIDDQDPGLTVPAGGELAFENIVLDGDGAGKGFGSFSVAIPDDPGLDGQEWFGRWYVTDTGGGSSHAVSRLFRFRTFLSTSGLTLFADGFESGDASAWTASAP